MVFITGASSGIGEACARSFATAKSPLWLVARRLERLEKLAVELRDKLSVEVRVSRLDVTQRDQVERFFADNRSALSSIQVLVNNAGLTRGLDPIQNGKLEDWEETIDTNIKGLLYVTHGFLPHFVSAGEGHIVNIGSVASRWTYPKGSIYCASKRAVSSLTEGMRLDLQGTGIRVTEIAPGLVETEFSRVRFRGDEERAKAVYRNKNCLRPNDVAEAIVWAVQRPKHVNIQEIVIYPTEQASTNHYLVKP